jgi:DNA-binding GntR family transcriptional regulator
MARASDLAYVTVRDRIIKGVYAGGSRITEQEIANSTGVSRTPVREALRRLEAEGFVKVTANHGAIVTEWTAQDTNNVFELRALLEPYGAAKAAENITPEGIQELRRLAEAQRRESESRAPDYVNRIRELNSAFHRVLHGYSGNTRLAALLPVLMEAPLVMKTFSSYESDDLMRSAFHHMELVAAMEAHDPEWAAAIMRCHIRAAHQTSKGFFPEKAHSDSEADDVESDSLKKPVAKVRRAAR